MPQRLIAIVGATATGKTALAIALARALDGEIVNADSRQVYRGMDIGTAKPTREEQAAARHWMLDVVAPDERYHLAAFLDGARAAIDDIASRGKMPILAGGTGQYIWALLEGWRVPRVPADRALRTSLDAQAKREGPETIVAQLRAIDPASLEFIDERNLRRVVRAIEVTRATGRPFSEWRVRDDPGYDTALLGLRLEREDLYRRIDSRVDGMLAAGLVDEVRGLIAAGHNCGLASMSGIGYRQVCEHLAGSCSLAEATARIKTETHRLARMQHAWFRDDDARIHWLDAGLPDLLAAAMERVSGLPGAGEEPVS